MRTQELHTHARSAKRAARARERAKHDIEDVGRDSRPANTESRKAKRIASTAPTSRVVDELIGALVSRARVFARILSRAHFRGRACSALMAEMESASTHVSAASACPPTRPPSTPECSTGTGPAARARRLALAPRGQPRERRCFKGLGRLRHVRARNLAHARALPRTRLRTRIRMSTHMRKYHARARSGLYIRVNGEGTEGRARLFGVDDADEADEEETRQDDDDDVVTERA
eukprot:6202830-Pleurochrysis_carterae.AAC.2